MQWGENEPVLRWVVALKKWGEAGSFLADRRARRIPVIDRAFGDPRLAAMRTAAREGGVHRWPELRSVLAAARDPEDLTFLVEGMQDVSGVEALTAEVIAGHPDDTLALLVSGARQVEWAWQAAGGGSATGTVPAGQPALFRERLSAAEARLLDVAEREPQWAAPWYFLQICARGLEAGAGVAESRFEAVRLRAPGHVAAHRQHLRQVSAAWGGSREQMFSFAREAATTAREGSGLGQLVALAHLEVWAESGAGQDSRVLCAPEVAGELHASAARSVHHPAFVRERDWAVGVNAFAMAFALAGEDAAARTMFRSVGRQVTEVPWRSMDDRSPVVPFLAWRARVGT